MIKHQGGCFCGNIRYSTEYDPMLVMACHCRSCKKLSGVGMTVLAVYGEGEVDFEGELKSYPIVGKAEISCIRSSVPIVVTTLWEIQKSSPV